MGAINVQASKRQAGVEHNNTYQNKQRHGQEMFIPLQNGQQQDGSERRVQDVRGRRKERKRPRTESNNGEKTKRVGISRIDFVLDWLCTINNGYNATVIPIFRFNGTFWEKGYPNHSITRILE